MQQPVVKGVAAVLAHTPNLVRYGSKPTRELPKDPALLEVLNAHQRSYAQARSYGPNQVFIGNLEPEGLWSLPRPWYRQELDLPRVGPWGEVVPEDEFLAWLKAVDEFGLVLLSEEFTAQVRPAFEAHPLVTAADTARLGAGEPLGRLEALVAAGAALPLFLDRDLLVGCMQPGHEEDDCLTAPVLLENLACKASGVLALRRVLGCAEVEPAAVEYVLGCGEEGVGDRYQRGAGNMAKAMAELSGCTKSSGSDVKAFCCSPVHALVVAAGLVAAGVFGEVAVVGGGSLAKLGMKMRGHLAHDLPILEDVLGAVAVLVGRDDGQSPRINLRSVGKHNVADGSSQQAIMESLVTTPLARLGKGILDVDKYALELHNPEVTEPAGSGNVPRANYRMLASLAVLRGELDPSRLDWFEEARGMPGFSPTQGHIAASIPYLGHARRALLDGRLGNAMFVAKGSLFLAKMTKQSDGMSFLLERS